MKITLPMPSYIEVTTIRVVLPVRYKDEDMPLDFPLRDGDEWKADIDIETGKIAGWPSGRGGNVQMKVVDEGLYYLLDQAGNTVASLEGDYVPSIIPGEFGDYVDLQIYDGTILNWKQPSEEDILKSFFNKR